MSKKLALATLAGALIMFFWGFAWFAGALLSTGAMKPLPEAGHAAIETLRGAGLTDGTYFYPNEADAERRIQGPMVRLSWHSVGVTQEDPSVMIHGFLHLLVSAGLLAAFMNWLAPALPTTKSRMLLAGAFGLFTAVYGRFGMAIWFFEPPAFPVFYAIYDLVGWLVAGAAMGAILKPTRS